MSTRLLVLPVLISLAVAAQAQRLPGCICFAHWQSLGSSLRTENAPVRFQLASDCGKRELALINPKRMMTPPEFRMHDLTRAVGIEVHNFMLFDQPFQIANPEHCGCIAPKQKITIPDGEMQRLHEETMQNSKRNATKNAPD